MKEAVLAGIVFIKTASEGILTRDTIPPQFILSVEDTEKKVSLYVRQDVTEQAARSTGAEKSVKQHVAAFEGRISPCAQTGEAASSSTDIPKQFAGKFKAPSPIRLPDTPGYAEQLSAMGLLSDQLRGSTSPNQSCLKSPCSYSRQGLPQHLGEVFARCSFCSKLAP